MRDARTHIEGKQAHRRENLGQIHLRTGTVPTTWAPYAHRARRTPLPQAPTQYESAVSAEPLLAEQALAVLDHPQTLPEVQRCPADAHILIVEDDARAARAIREMLELEGDPTWMLELPVLFYVVCLMFFVTNRVDMTVLEIAWAYVGFRLAQTLVHITYNNVMHRLTMFAISNFVLLSLWGVFFLR